MPVTPANLTDCNAWPIATRVLTVVLLLILLAVSWWLQPEEVAAKGPKTKADLDKGPESETGRGQWRCLTPAFSALVAAITVVACLFASRFLEVLCNERLHTLHDLVAAPPDELDGHDFGARALYAVTMGLTLLATMAAAWVTSAVWRRCPDRRFARQIAVWVALAAVLGGMGISVLALLKVTQGLASGYGNALLCANWVRSGAPWMAMLTDANNVIGIFVPVVLTLGMCLLLEPLGRSKMDTTKLEAVAVNSHLLDVLLYVGAACLALGILYLSALYASALAPLPSAASVKVRAEACKSLTLPSGMSDMQAQTQLMADWCALKCHTLAKEAKNAETADSAREFAKISTLVFGISFSALLAAMYLPAMLLLKRAAEESSLPDEPGLPASRAQRTEQYLKLGIESDMLSKVGKVLTALSPILASVIANALSTIG